MSDEERFMARLEDAIALQHAGDNVRAAEAFMDIFRDFPDDARLPDEAGNILLYAANEPRKAIACYEKALPLVEDPTEVCFKIGFAHATAGDDAAASQWFARAHEHTPTHANTFLEVGKLHMRAGKHQDALEFFTTAWAHHVMGSMLSGGPDPHFQALALMNQARIHLLHLGNVDEGLKAVRALLEELGDPQRVETLAQELRAAGKTDLAARLAKMVEDSPVE